MSGWRDRAACVGYDSEIFFPKLKDVKAIRKAQEVCSGCPVIEQCGRFADEHPRIDGYSVQGVWGGRLRLGKKNI